MSRATTKSELISLSIDNYDKLNKLISELTEKELSTPFDFSSSINKKELHWKRDKNLRDVLVHLYEWHQLLLTWILSNQNGESKPFLPSPYNWKTYGELNIKFWEKHQNTSLEDAKAMFQKSHEDVLSLAETFSNDKLFSKGIFEWVGTNALGSYFTSNMSSHYDWAMKKLKAHKKNCSNTNH